MSRPSRVLFVSGRHGAPTLRYRVRLAEEALRGAGIQTAAVHDQAGRLRRWAAEADAVAVYRAPASENLFDLLTFCAERGIPTTYDIDDRVFLPRHLEDIPFVADLSDEERSGFEATTRSNGLLLPVTQALSASTAPLLAEMVEERGGAAPGGTGLLHNGVGRVTAHLADRTRRDRAPGSRVRIAYFSGSATHDADWAAVEPDLLRVVHDHPGTELWVVGSVRLSPRWNVFGSRVVRLSSVPWTDLPELIAGVDINLAPLEVSPFTAGKSAIKWLEAALVRTPTVATATQPFREAITDGAGVLVEPGADWYGPVAALVQDPSRRADLGDQARAAAYASFGPEVQSERYGAFYRSLATSSVDAAAVRSAIDRARSIGPLVDGPRRRLEPYPFPEGLDETTFTLEDTRAKPSNPRAPRAGLSRLLGAARSR